jgi:octaprenyl-diphosphate synthase
VGNDIREGKVTLPLINAMAKADSSEAKKILSIVKSKRADRKDVSKVIDFVERHGGIDSAQERAETLQQQAVRELDAFEPSVYRSALIDFANFVVTRTS